MSKSVPKPRTRSASGASPVPAGTRASFSKGQLGPAARTLGALALFAVFPSLAAAHHPPKKGPPAAPLPTCAQLATDPAYGLAGNPEISALTATLVPLGTGVSVAYCRVDFTFSGEEGPKAGYLPGQKEQNRLRVGLPASTADGGTGGVQGAWNGKTRDLGGGGYAGSVGGVTSSTNLGYVGTSTDTGHDSQVTPGATFALNADKTLNWGLIEDFGGDSNRQQYLWGQKLAKTYYGKSPVRKYWMGCSLGGKQGHWQAQNFPDAYDGILGGAPAINWDRFSPSKMWSRVVWNQTLGAIIPSAKLAAVSNAAIAACDAVDGITDGIIQDTRRCNYDASAFVCTGGPTDPANCLTAAEAGVVNKIWNGPVASPSKGGWHHGSGRAWYGYERGTPLASVDGTLVDTTRYLGLWVMRDPAFDWKTLTETTYFDAFVKSVKTFNDAIGADDGLERFRRSGGKMITYHGLFDNQIPPRGTYNYYNNIKGSLREKQEYYRFFPYPNAGHCSGAGLNAEQLFTALVDWVEKKVEPDEVVAQVSATRTRKICMYPNEQVYKGGSIDDHNSFTCERRHRDDPALLKQDVLDRRFLPDEHAGNENGHHHGHHHGH